MLLLNSSGLTILLKFWFIKGHNSQNTKAVQTEFTCAPAQCNVMHVYVSIFYELPRNSNWETSPNRKQILFKVIKGAQLSSYEGFRNRIWACTTAVCWYIFILRILNIHEKVIEKQLWMEEFLNFHQLRKHKTTSYEDYPNKIYVCTMVLWGCMFMLSFIHLKMQ